MRLPPEKEEEERAQAPRGRKGPHTAKVHRFIAGGWKPGSAGAKPGAKGRAVGLAAPCWGVAGEKMDPWPLPSPVLVWRGEGGGEAAQSLPPTPFSSPSSPFLSAAVRDLQWGTGWEAGRRGEDCKYWFCLQVGRIQSREGQGA